MRIGFIGTGRMGNPMARHLIEKGHQLKVHDLVHKATTNLEEMGAKWAATPKAASQGSDVVFTSLPGPKEVEAAVTGGDGVIEGAARGAVYIDLSTSSPTSTRKIAQALQARGVDMLDAPVSGGVVGAEAATLAVMVGGDEAVYRRVKPVLDCIGDKAMYCGPLGSGMVCKICNNLVTLSLAAFLPEVLTMGVKAGVDLEVLAKAITSGSGQNYALEKKYPNKLFKGDFDPGFSLAMAAKDMGLASALGKELGLPMEVANVLEQRYVEAMGRGLGPKDSDVVATLYEERTGVKLRLRGAKKS